MTQRINVAEYHNRPLLELELPDGTVWKVRQPLEADYYAYQDVVTTHRKRVLGYGKEMAAKALEITDGSEDDAVAREFLERESDEDNLPVEYTIRYMEASIVAIFVTPAQTPTAVLDALGPDILHELFFRLQEVIGGEAAKKRMARGT